ncbi:MAG: hypothetical protein HY815_13445 [Candidatus Riflebacteria bacterium]|nr:hypothetical protein [Candidatus Riflebacteria bacterium]
MSEPRVIRLVLIAVALAWSVCAQGQTVLGQNGQGTNGPNTGDINTNVGAPNPGVITRPITRAEAEAMLPPPLPVINIANAAMVFNSPDEMVRAAVADWLSRIKQPHDQYGNIINKYYRGAHTPDKVDGALIQHIVEYTKGRRLIALSALQAQSLANMQQNTRQNAIDDIIVRLTPRPSGNQNQNRNNNNGSGPGGGGGGQNNQNVGGGNENVPSLNNNNNPSPGNNNTPPSNNNSAPPPNDNNAPPSNDNNTPPSNNNNAPPSNNNNAPPSNNNNAPPSNNNNAPPSNNNNAPPSNNNNTPSNNNNGGAVTPAELARQLESKYGVTVAFEPKPWTLEELQWIDYTLAIFPASAYTGLRLERVAVVIIDGQQYPTAFGVTFPTGQTAGLIQLADIANSTDPSWHYTDFPKPPWPDEEGRRAEFIGTLAHELGHEWQYYRTGTRSPNVDQDDKIKQWAREFGWTYDSENGSWSFDQTRRQERPTDYAVGSPQNPTSPLEDMCESILLYLMDPLRLQQTQTASSANGTSRYDFIKNVVGLPPQPADPNRTFPAPGFR